MDDIFERPNVPTMFDQDDDMLSVLLRSLQFRSEPFVVLHDVVAQFVKILLAVDQQFRIVKIHIVRLWQFRYEPLDALPIKLCEDLLDGMSVFTTVDLNDHT